MIRKYLFIVCALLLVLNAYGASKLKDGEVPRTAYKDTYKYYILEMGKQATVYSVIIKRQSFSTMMFIKAEINCPSHYFRELGHSERSASTIATNNPTRWYKPVIGSIEADIITYVCR